MSNLINIESINGGFLCLVDTVPCYQLKVKNFITLKSHLYKSDVLVGVLSKKWSWFSRMFSLSISGVDFIIEVPVRHFSSIICVAKKKYVLSPISKDVYKFFQEGVEVGCCEKNTNTVKEEKIVKFTFEKDIDYLIPFISYCIFELHARNYL